MSMSGPDAPLRAILRVDGEQERPRAGIERPLPPHRSPLEVAEQGAHQLADAAVVGGHHALQAHHQVLAVLGVEHHQLVLPRGDADSSHLGRRQRGSGGKEETRS